ncbi:hypothetical protein [Persephonella sp.]
MARKANTLKNKIQAISELFKQKQSSEGDVFEILNEALDGEYVYDVELLASKADGEKVRVIVKTSLKMGEAQRAEIVVYENGTPERAIEQAKKIGIYRVLKAFGVEFPATEKQINYIKDLLKELQINEKEAVKDILHAEKPLENLNSTEASKMIDVLKTLRNKN